jgi:hypothetical protein
MVNETEEILMVASTCEAAPDRRSGGFVPRRTMRVWWYGQSIGTNNAVPHHPHAWPVRLAGEDSGWTSYSSGGGGKSRERGKLSSFFSDGIRLSTEVLVGMALSPISTQSLALLSSFWGTAEAVSKNF